MGVVAEFMTRATAINRTSDSPMPWRPWHGSTRRGVSASQSRNRLSSAPDRRRRRRPDDERSPACPYAQRGAVLKDILRSYPGSPRYGSVETRGLDSEFAWKTYVKPAGGQATGRDSRGRVRLVVLCGNAGDGKTAFLQYIADKLGVPRRSSASAFGRSIGREA